MSDNENIVMEQEQDEETQFPPVKEYFFPDGTVFYRDLIVDGDVKKLGMATKDPKIADAYGYLDQYINESELTYVPNSDSCGIYYIKGHEKPAETPEEYIARRESEIVNMVQELIDSTANQKRYDTGESCCSYVGDPDEEFNADAVAFQAWRGRCWRICYNILDSVKAGTVAPEDVTDEYVLERLPVMEWPNV